MKCHLLNYLRTRRLHGGISTVLAIKYNLLRWCSCLSNLSMESLESIKREKNFWQDSFYYCKIQNMRHHTNQIGLFRLPKISKQSKINEIACWKWCFDRSLADRFCEFSICFKLDQQQFEQIIHQQNIQWY